MLLERAGSAMAVAVTGWAPNRRWLWPKRAPVEQKRKVNGRCLSWLVK